MQGTSTRVQPDPQDAIGGRHRSAGKDERTLEPEGWAEPLDGLSPSLDWDEWPAHFGAAQHGIP